MFSEAFPLLIRGFLNFFRVFSLFIEAFFLLSEALLWITYVLVLIFLFLYFKSVRAKNKLANNSK